MAFRDVIARFVNGELRADEMPAVAMQAIEEGYDSPSLCQLAVLEDADPQRASTLFQSALEEFQIRLPTAGPLLIVRRYPYEEPYNAHLEFLASNGTFTGATDIYCTLSDIVEIGRALKAFPASGGDEYKYEYGSPDPRANWARYFVLRAFTIDRVGHCALQFTINLNQAEPDEGACRFSIRVEAAGINRLGELFEEFAKLGHLELRWGPAVGKLHETHQADLPSVVP
jgi:hypothetical protein